MDLHPHEELARSQPDADRFREACAVIAVWNLPDAARIAAQGLYRMQHRGQEGSGIVTYDGRWHRRAAAGLVKSIYTHAALAALPGKMAFGHNRYSTSGANGGNHLSPTLEIDGDKATAMTINGNLPTTYQLDKSLRSAGIDTKELGLNDTEKMSRDAALQVLGGLGIAGAIKRAFPRWKGAFAGAATDGKDLVAFRDQYGLRPLVLGTKDGGWIVASETCALDAVGAKFERDIRPGELLTITAGGDLVSEQLAKPKLKFDIFELIYFASPESKMFGKTVGEIRHESGRRLAAEAPVAADIVVPILGSAKHAAEGYAEKSGIDYIEAIIKNPDELRTFILADQNNREAAVARKFAIIANKVKGKRIVLVDDSMVRGTTTTWLVHKLKEAGATEVHVRVASPPIKHPHIYGVDIKTHSELIANIGTLDQIRQKIEADSLAYLSMKGLIASTGQPAVNFDLSPFNGRYSIPSELENSTLQFVADLVRGLFAAFIGRKKYRADRAADRVAR